MNLENFVRDLKHSWEENGNRSFGLAGPAVPYEIGIKGEEYVLRKMKRDFKGYQFCLTPGSRTPADLVGFIKEREYLQFVLIQVKTSTNERTLTPDIDEKETLPELVRTLKECVSHSRSMAQLRTRAMLISTGYFGVLRMESGRGKSLKVKHKVFKRKLYQCYAMNNLNEIRSRSQQFDLARRIHE